MARTKNWEIVEAGTVSNPGSFARVANATDVKRWWKGAKSYSYESYATREQAEARVQELRDARATELDAARTLTWVNLATSFAQEQRFHAAR